MGLAGSLGLSGSPGPLVSRAKFLTRWLRVSIAVLQSFAARESGHDGMQDGGAAGEPLVVTDPLVPFKHPPG